MVLLHHRVVPGLGDGVRPRREAVVAGADQTPCGDRELAPVEATLTGVPAGAAAAPVPPAGPTGTVAVASAAESTRAA
jgi:hypothetical protein